MNFPWEQAVLQASDETFPEESWYGEFNFSQSDPEQYSRTSNRNHSEANAPKHEMSIGHTYWQPYQNSNTEGINFFTLDSRENDYLPGAPLLSNFTKVSQSNSQDAST